MLPPKRWRAVFLRITISPFIDLLCRNQIKWDPEYRVPDVHAGLVEMGRIAGMSAQKVDSCIADQRTAQKISEVGNEPSDKFGINSTPTFVDQRPGAAIHRRLGQDLQDYLNNLLKKK